MVSSHFPSTWGHDQGWLVLLGIAGAGLAVRHAINVAERGTPMPWLWPVAAALFAAAALYARPKRADPGSEGVPIAEVQVVIAKRCLGCHTAQPFLGGLSVPPKGLVLDRPETIEAWRDKIALQVASMAMPAGNLTEMTPEERELIARWAQGAP